MAKFKERGRYNNFYGNWKVGEGTRIGSFCDVGGIIGKNCKIQSYAFICPGVEIGDSVFIGPHTTFTNNKFPKVDNPNFIPEKTIVKDGVVIGAGCVILPGITINTNAFIGAGSVVLESVPDGETWVGNPARKLTK
jgi:UDP-2-acetamido-3-amino-2,3-dideoxy-glucuronate N-acetyltransferase